MAFIHYRAAQEIKVGDKEAKNILTTIAADIGVNGEPAFPSYRTIANRTEIHYNTIGKKITLLEDAGLIRVEKRGKRQYYTLLFDCTNRAEAMTDYDNEQELSHLECDNSLSQSITTLSQKVSQLADRLSQLETPLSHSPRDLSSEAVEADGEAVAPPLEQPQHLRNMQALEDQRKHPDPIKALVSALADITNKPPSIQPIADAAYTLFGYDATAEELYSLYSGAGSYWLTASDSPGVWANSPRPSIGNIVNDFLNARAWAQTPAAAASSAASDAERYHAEFIAPLAAMNGHGREHLMTAPEIVRKAVHMAIGNREVTSAKYVTPELLAANMRLVAMQQAS